MTTFRQLEIRRVYSASPARAAAASATVPAPPIGVSRLGIATLVVASAWIYAAWFPTDRFMIAAMIRTQLNQPPEVSGVDFSILLKRPGPESEGPAPPEGTEPIAPIEALQTAGSTSAPDPERVAQAQRETKYLLGDMFCWLAVMTMTGCHLALCAGSSITLTPIVDAQRRRQLILAALAALLLSILLAWGLWHQDPFAKIPKPIAEVGLVSLAAFVSWVMLVMVTPRTAGWLAVVVAVLLLVGGFYTWQAYGTGYPTAAPRIAAVMAMTIALLAGATATRRSFQLYGYAILTILAATILTVAAIRYADHLGGFQEKSPPLQTYALIAMVQLSYALVLTVVQAVLSRKLATT